MSRSTALVRLASVMAFPHVPVMSTSENPLMSFTGKVWATSTSVPQFTFTSLKLKFFAEGSLSLALDFSPVLCGHRERKLFQQLSGRAGTPDSPFLARPIASSRPELRGGWRSSGQNSVTRENLQRLFQCSLNQQIQHLLRYQHEKTISSSPRDSLCNRNRGPSPRRQTQEGVDPGTTDGHDGNAGEIRHQQGRQARQGQARGHDPVRQGKDDQGRLGKEKPCRSGRCFHQCSGCHRQVIPFPVLNHYAPLNPVERFCFQRDGLPVTSTGGAAYL